MRDVGIIIKAGAAILMLLFMTAPVWAANNPEGYYQKNEHAFEQDVEGEGYAMVYQKVNTATLQLQNYMHGSGDMDSATLIYSNQSKGCYYPVDNKYIGTYKSSMEYPAKSNISFVEQNEMNYAPVAMPYGTGYYEQNPIVYNSKLKEKTCGKSYQEGVSMHHQIEYARGFVKDIGVDLKCAESTPEKKGYGHVEMRIDEEVTEGAVHVGELVTRENEVEVDDNGNITGYIWGGWREPLIEIDENYAGSFKITKNMKYTTEKSGVTKVKSDWLSCCFGGYDGMDEINQVGICEGIFNCDCYNLALAEYDPEWGGNPDYGNQTEQFPRMNN